MKKTWREVFWWIVSSGLVLGAAIGTSYLFSGAYWSGDVAFALTLLALNQAFFGVAVWLRDHASPEFGLIPGLLWILAKLFVNTFTIFLLIGLQAVRSSVFVPVFFIAYAVVLFSGILRINFTNTKQRVISDE